MTAPIPPVPITSLVAWLREHVDAFTEEALRDRLLAAGYPPAEIDAAFEILRREPDAIARGSSTLGAESPAVPRPAPGAWPPSQATDAEARLMRDSALAFIVAIGTIIGIPWLLATVGAGAYAFPVALVFILLAFAGWAGSRHGTHPGVATGLGVALLIVVVLPVVAIVAVFGFCLVAGGRVV